MPARAPSLGSSSNPFGVSNYSFGAFNLGGGSDPTQSALSDAADARYAVGVRYGNGQATEAEYQAAIAAERAIAASMAQSTEESVRSGAQKHLVELDNLSHDVKNHSAEVTAAAVDDDGQALLAVYQQELSSMTAGSTGYTELSDRISRLQTSIGNAKAADNSRQAAYELAVVQNAWQAGTATDDDYKAAYAKYADSQKPGTSEWENAHANLTDLTFKLDRNALVAKVNDHRASSEDLLAFDAHHLDSIPDQGSQGYRDALDAYRSSQALVWNEGQTKTDAAYQAHQMTSVQALDWYKQQLVGRFSDNPQIMDDINSRITTLNGNVQAERDTAAINQFNDGTMKPQDFLAYAKGRAAAFPVGTTENADWLSRADKAATAAVQPGLVAAYGYSQHYIQLQKFIADNSAPPASGTKTTTKQILGPNGWRTVTSTSATAPTPAELDAWKKRQAEVADAKVELAELQQQIGTTPTGFVTSQKMLAYWQQQQAKVAAGSPEWYSLQGNIDTVNSNIHAESLLAGGGIKVSYPGAGDGTTSGTGAVDRGGAGGSRPAGSVGGVANSGGAAAGPAKPGSLDSAASTFLKEIGAPDTVGNRQAMRTWFNAEGVSSSFARNNPLNLHSKGGLPGQTASVYVNENDTDVAQFDTLENGVKANARNLLNLAGSGYGYDKIIAALRGNNPQGFLDALSSSSWAASGYGTRTKVKGADGKAHWVANGKQSNLYSTWSRSGDMTLSTKGGGSAPIGGRGMSAPTGPRVDPNKGMTADDFLRGLGKAESGGDYGNRNSKTGAFGKYQILPGNWTAWAAKYLGDANAAPTPENQEKVAKAKVGELYTWLGSYQAVAHWWLTGGSDKDVHGDPARWGATDSAYVNNVMRYAGGAVTGGSSTHLPSSPSATGSTSRYAVPATVITAPAGKGNPSGLQAVVPGSESRDPKSGLTTRTTVPIDFPSTLSGDQFEGLYGNLHHAIFDKNAVSYVYRDQQTGQTVNILLPDNPIGRADLVNKLDASRIQLAQEAAHALQGKDGEAAANLHLTAAVHDAGTNQLKLLDTEYGGNYKKGSDMYAAAAGVTSPATSRGLGANPNPVRSKGSKTNPLLGDMTKAGRDDAMSNAGLVQTNSLTPLAAGLRVTQYAETYVAGETARANQAWKEGRTTDALIHLQNVNDATNEHSTLIQQIGVYNAQAHAQADAIDTAYGAPDVPDQVAADLKTLGGFSDAIAASKADADKLMGEIKPFIKTTPAGDIVWDVGPTGATAAAAPGTMSVVSRTSSGGIAVKHEVMPPGGYGSMDRTATSSGGGKYVKVQIPVAAGSKKLMDNAYTTWHLDTIGWFQTADGQKIPVMGRVLDIPDANGQLIVENPFQQDKWAPGPIIFDAPPGAKVRLTPTTDAKGQPDGRGQAVTFDDGKGNAYKLWTDAKTGQLNITVHGTDGSGKAALVELGQANTPPNRASLSGMGIGLPNLALNTRETVGFLSMPNINGPWAGISFDTAQQIQRDPRVKLFGQQLAEDIGKGFGSIVSRLWDPASGSAAAAAPGSGPGHWTGDGHGHMYWQTAPTPNVAGPFDWLNPPGVNAGVPSSPTTIGAPPPAPTQGVRPFLGPPAPPTPAAGAGVEAAPVTPVAAIQPRNVEASASASLAPITPPVTNRNLPKGTADAQVQFSPPRTTDKAPTVKPAAKPTPSVGAGAGAAGSAPPARSNTPNVQATATLPVIKPPVKSTPTPAPVRSGPNRQA